MNRKRVAIFLKVLVSVACCFATWQLNGVPSIAILFAGKLGFGIGFLGEFVLNALVLGGAVYALDRFFCSSKDTRFSDGIPAVFVLSTMLAVTVAWSPSLNTMMTYNDAVEISAQRIRSWNPDSPVLGKISALAPDTAHPNASFNRLQQARAWLDDVNGAWLGDQAVARARLYQTGVAEWDGTEVLDVTRDGVWTTKQDLARRIALLQTLAQADPSDPRRSRASAALAMAR